MNSTHKVEVVPVSLETHPDADSLSIVRVHDGYNVVVNTKMWENIELGAYLPPDSLVDTTRAEFSFLKNPDRTRTKERIKVRRLRGILSMGLLVPAPEGSKIGDDVAEQLGVEHWQPPEEYEPVVQGTTRDRNVGGPPLYCPKYDIDNWYRYLRLFEEGEPVYISEKIHGSNMKMVYLDDKQYVGSRNFWKEESDDNVFWLAFRENPRWAEICKEYPGTIFFGECYGKNKGFKYDCDTLPRFRAFDILYGDKWMDSDMFIRFCWSNGIPYVPTIEAHFPLVKDKLASMAEGQSLIGNHIREGIVIKPMKERWDNKLGRVCLKLIGEGYYSKS